MAAPTVHQDYSFSNGIIAPTPNATACIEAAQAKIGLNLSLLIFGAALPLLLWPLLPSTSEIRNYRLLMSSSCAQFFLVFLWRVFHPTDGIFDGLWFQFWVTPLLCCSSMLGYEGCKAERLRRRLRRDDFTSVTNMTWDVLMSALFIAGDYRLRPLVGNRMGFEGSPNLLVIAAVSIICCLSTSLLPTWQRRPTTDSRRAGFLRYLGSLRMVQMRSSSRGGHAICTML
jgi:hypothetical protein